MAAARRAFCFEVWFLDFSGFLSGEKPYGSLLSRIVLPVAVCWKLICTDRILEVAGRVSLWIFSFVEIDKLDDAFDQLKREEKTWNQNLS